MKITIEGIPVIFDGIDDATPEEAKNYLDFVRSKVSINVDHIIVKPCDDGFVDVSYVAKFQKFERIRRITGYLTGDLNSWNDAKQAEESDRVKHS